MSLLFIMATLGQVGANALFQSGGSWFGFVHFDLLLVARAFAISGTWYLVYICEFVSFVSVVVLHPTYYILPVFVYVPPIFHVLPI